jgi:hypothetical protein
MCHVAIYTAEEQDSRSVIVYTLSYPERQDSSLFIYAPPLARETKFHTQAQFCMDLKVKLSLCLIK